jgi:hypothetical protein
MIPADETFDGTWPFAPHYCDAAGFRQHYVDEGSGRPVLLLHGQPTWGYIWRRFIAPLAATHRMIVPRPHGVRQKRDARGPRVHVTHPCRQPDRADRGAGSARHHPGDAGLGRSDRRRLRGAPSGARPQPGADEHGRGYGTAGRRDLPNPMETPWFRWIRDGLPTGRTEAVLSQLGSTILSVMQIVGLERLDRVDPTFIRAYGAPFPRRRTAGGDRISTGPGARPDPRFRARGRRRRRRR